MDIILIGSLGIVVFLIFYAILLPFYFQKEDSNLNNQSLFSSENSSLVLENLPEQLEEHQEELENGKLSEEDYQKIATQIKRKIIQIKEKSGA